MGIMFQVLDKIRNAESTMDIDQLAKSLNMEKGALEGVLEFWVRKGKITRVNDTFCAGGNCNTCGSSCPFAGHLPEGLVIYQPETE